MSSSRSPQLGPADETILDVRDLEVAVGPQRNPRLVVRGVSLQIRSGEIYGLLGESGSGKSMTVQAINGLLPAGARVTRGSVRYRGEELVGARRKRLAQIRGERIGMVFQDSLTSLNPIMRIGPQVAEPLLLHHKASRREARALVRQRLSAMGMADAEHVVHRYPHEFSGGMRQRATIATALIDNPELLIADEPTTALDVTVQAQILDICRRMNEELGVAILLISHDLGVLSEICTTIGVMYAGRIVQTGPTRALLERPSHPYTRALVELMPRAASAPGTPLKAIGGEPPSPEALPEGCKFNPRCAFAIARCRIEEPALTLVGETRSACWVAQSGSLPPMGVTVGRDEAHQAREPARWQTREALLTASGLRRYFTVPSDRLFGRPRHVHAVDGVSIALRRGETLGIVGESGCGKSTLARCLLRLTDLDAGQIVFMGRDITTLAGDELRRIRREMQPIFQDPYASLNPRQRIADIVAEPLAVNGFSPGETASRINEVLDLVGLGQALADRFPHQLSGGQRQRVGIARAIVLRPALIVADEPISSLDLSIQAQIINLLRDLQQRFDLTLVFISHDLRVVRQICSEIAVMFLGQIVESGPTEEVCAEPRHPYTRALLASVPEFSFTRDRRRGALLSGDPPSPISPPSGCRFRTRCAFAKARCAEAEPALGGSDPDHVFACHYPLPVGRTAIARGGRLMSDRVLDIDAIREREFPIARSRVYLNNCARGPLPRSHVVAVETFLHAMSDEMSDGDAEVLIEETRERAARLLNCRTEEVALLSTTSQGLNLVPGGLDWRSGDEVILYEMDHPTDIYAWLNLADRGVTARFVKDRGGRYTTEDVEALIGPRTRAVCLSLVNYGHGFRAPVEAIGAICRKHGIWLVIDAIMALGALKVDAQAIGADIIVAHGYKFLLSGFGVAICYCSPRTRTELRVPEAGYKGMAVIRDYGTRQPDFARLAGRPLDFTAGARRFEAGTQSLAIMAGMKASLDLMLSVGIEAMESRILALAAQLTDGLRAKGYRIAGSTAAGERSAIVSFTRNGLDPLAVSRRLNEARIDHIVTHDRPKLSPHFYNTAAEVDAALACL